MPYLSQAERKLAQVHQETNQHVASLSARWMTLIEALEHIRPMARFGSVEAQLQLKAAIGHRLIPVKWADSEGPKDAPDISYLQGSQFVLFKPGLALDDGSGRLRPLLVLRSAALSTWPSPGCGAAIQGIQKAKQGPSTRAEKERARWMTLVQAVEHIRVSQNCDQVEALRQLKIEIYDGIVPVKWADSKGARKPDYSHFRPAGTHSVASGVLRLDTFAGPLDIPDPVYLKQSEFLLVGTGFAPDQLERTYRPLMCDRSAILRIWSIPNDREELISSAESRSSEMRSAQAGPHDHKMTQLKPHRGATDDEIDKALSEIYDVERRDDPPNVNKAFKLLRQKLPDLKLDRNEIRTRLKDTSTYPRRPVGKQPKF